VKKYKTEFDKYKKIQTELRKNAKQNCEKIQNKIVTNTKKYKTELRKNAKQNCEK
jgi:hypothetical protein